MRFLTLSLFATLLSAPAFAADLGTYRPGTPYNSTVAAGADVCDSQCAGDAQCRGWNYVKPNPQAPGICEYLSTVSTAIPSQISISGENFSAASFSPRVTSGGTNTIRVGTQVSRSSNTVKVGQSPSGRRIVRRAPQQRITPQLASTKPVENMSLTAQQNRYRQGHMSQPQGQAPAHQQQRAPQQQAVRPAMPQQRPVFRPMLDANSAQRAAQPVQPRRPQRAVPQQAPQPVQKQASRRATGPRRANAQRPAQAQPQYAPQYQRPYPQASYSQTPYPQTPAAAEQNYAQRGQSRPPVGQPIPQAQQQPRRPVASTPSQRLAQLTAQTPGAAEAITTTGPMALTPEQTRKSLFGSLNDDLPTASAVPTTPVTQQELGDVLAGGR